MWSVLDTEEREGRNVYVIEASNKTGTAEKRCRTKEKAVKIASIVASDGRIKISNPELNEEQKWFEVDHVRVYDTKNPDVDIDF